MLKTLLLLLACTLTLMGSPARAALSAGAGKRVATLPVNGARMLADPIRPFVYVVTQENELVVIDTTTLKVVKKFFVGSVPRGMAIALDGSKLLVANTGSSTAGLAVVDLQTLTLAKSISLPAAPFDVAAGKDGRAFVLLTNGAFYEVDLADGSTEAFGEEQRFLYNRLQNSPDGATLYVASLGYSPSSLGTFNAVTSPPTFQKVVWDAGANGRDLILSHDGRILTMPSGGGNAEGYSIHLFDASNIEAHFGTLETGAYPHNGAFSLDDTLYYTAPDERDGEKIQVYSVATQQQVGVIPIGQGDIDQLICEGNGRYLFCLQRAAPEGTEEPPFEIHVFTTGEEPFRALAGTYALTVTDVSQGYHSAMLTLLPNGTYSGSLRAHGRKFAFKGSFLSQPARTFSFTIAGFPPVILQLESMRETAERVLMASLDLGSGPVPLSILKRTDFKAGAPPFAGPFTWHAPAEAGEKLGPSTGRIVVNKSGAVIVVGLLGDRTRIAQGGFVLDAAKFVLNVPLFGGKGYFGGLLRFRDVSDQSDADATVSWVRPALPKSKFRPEGFALTRAMRGSKYRAPAAGAAVLQIQSGNLSLFSDSQTSLSTTPVSFITRSSIAPTGSDPYTFKAKVNLATGAFSGSFALPGDRRRVKFSGQVLQKTAEAVGVFKTDVDYGTALLMEE